MLSNERIVMLQLGVGMNGRDDDAVGLVASHKHDIINNCVCFRSEMASEREGTTKILV